MYRLATCAETLRVWEADSYEKLYDHSPIAGSSLTATSWSPDAACIASLIKGQTDKILFTYTKNRVLTSTEISTIAEPVAVLFPKTTQKHIIIGSSGRIALFETARTQVRKEFPATNLTCLTTNYNDRYIAYGSSSGTVHLLNATTGQTSSPLKQPNSLSITSLRYNNIRHSMLGSCSEDGGVVYWDSNSNKKIHSFSEHSAPATCITFSPVNELLSLSSGLDKKCIMYDTQTKKAVSTIRTAFPLTSVDFHFHGIELALGTTKGQVLIYDLRAMKTPTKILNAHSGRVNAVAFQPMNDRLSLSKTRSKVHLSSATKENRSAEVNSLQLPDTSAEFRKDTSLSSQVFSPLREDNLSLNSNRPSLAASFTSNLSTDSVFSPLRENSFNHSPLTSGPRADIFTTGRSGSALGGSGLMASPLAAIREEPGSPTKTWREPDRFGSQETEDSVDSPFGGRGSRSEPSLPPVQDRTAIFASKSSSSLFDKKDLSAAPSSEAVDMDWGSPEPSSPVPSMSNPESYTRENINEMRATLQAFPRAMLEHDSPRNDLPTAVRPPSVPASVTPSNSSSIPPSTAPSIATSIPPSLASSIAQPMAPVIPVAGDGSFQQEYLHNVVQEAMEEFCFDMRQQMWRMQYDIIRSFQGQQDDLKELLEQYAGVNDQLVEENQRLRQEIQMMKKYY